MKYHGKSRPDLPDGCPDRFDWEFTKWIWDTRITSREMMRKLFDAAPPQKLKRKLRSSREVDSFLSEVKNMATQSTFEKGSSQLSVPTIESE